MRLAPYTEYRDSGFAWLASMPSHWQQRRIKNILKEVDNRSSTGSEPLLKVSQYTGVTKRGHIGDSGEQDTRASSLVGYKKVAKDQLVVNIMLAWNGSFGISSFEGIASPAYCVYEFRKQECSPIYVHHLMKTESFKGRIKIESTGIVESRLRLYTEDFYRLEISLPPLKEQDAIVRFIRHIDQRVNKLIKAKKRLIELLNEQKQAIIHAAVTKGLNPDVPLKGSGVEWLGDIPMHWEVKRIKEIALHNPSKSEIKGLGPETPVTVLPMEAVSEWGVLEMTMEEKLASVQSGLTYMRNGDVSIAKITPCFENGKGASLDGLPFGFAFGSTEFHVLRPLSVITSDFLYFVTRMPKFRELGELNMKGSAGQKRVPSDFVKNFQFGLPSQPEQDQIVLYLRQALGGFDKTVDKVRAEIDLIREYRTRLVSDVVTGQLDVRGLDIPEIDEQFEEFRLPDEEFYEEPELEEALA
ncbi:restriction endonuclease subunit S [bacterium]|nr:restriction endonuclease subunit S [bacterium]